MCVLKNKLDQWEEWCFGDDVNSISHQIHRMIWDSAVFQCINEGRRYAPMDDEGQPELNATVHTFINRCFFQTQAIAFRRLLDTRSDVISLYRLIDDIRQNCHLLTRAGVLAAYGYPYDYEQARQEPYRAEQQHAPANRIGQDFIACTHSETIHGFMDALTGVDSSQRKPIDSVRPEIFEWLITRLNGCQEIFDYVNKFFAHSATPESRAQIGADEIKITLGKILETHKVVCETAAFIGMKILYRSHGNFLAIPQYDQFEHFEKPWATEETVNKLRSFWDEYRRSTDEWAEWDWRVEFNGRN